MINIKIWNKNIDNNLQYLLKDSFNVININKLNLVNNKTLIITLIINNIFTEVFRKWYEWVTLHSFYRL